MREGRWGLDVITLPKLLLPLAIPPPEEFMEDHATLPGHQYHHHYKHYMPPIFTISIVIKSSKRSIPGAHEVIIFLASE